MSSDNLQPDRLTQGLPVELFTKIVELAQAQPKCAYLGLVSKAFLPLARQHRFGKTTIRSYDKLVDLCTLSRTHDFVQSIKDFTLELEEVHDPSTPKKAEFHALLKRLHHVGKVKAKGSGRLAKEILDPKSNLRASKPPLGTTPLPAMKTLEIDDPFSGYACPFDPRHYGNLKHYRSLRRLSLTIDRAPDSIGRYRSTPVQQIEAALGFAWSVSLTGHLANQPAVRDLLHAFNEVAVLTLIDRGQEDGPDVFGPLLGSIRHLCFLQVLSMQRTHPLASLHDCLTPLKGSRFLCCLEFGVGAWNSQLLLPTLKHFPVLESIFFLDGVHLSDADLRNLLDGPDKPPKLDTIGVNCTEVMTYNSWEGIVTNPWSATCTFAGTLQNMALAKRLGIILCGSLINYADDERWFYEAVASGEIVMYDDEDDWW